MDLNESANVNVAVQCTVKESPKIQCKESQSPIQSMFGDSHKIRVPPQAQTMPGTRIIGAVPYKGELKEQI